jgi:hypothetical protein
MSMTSPKSKTAYLMIKAKNGKVSTLGALASTLFLLALEKNKKREHSIEKGPGFRIGRD